MAQRLRGKLAIVALRALPKNAISRAVGSLAALRLPRPLLRAQIRIFGRAVGLDFDEVRDPLDSFASFQEFFARALRDGARPIDPAPDAFVAPCDGSWGASGKVADGTALQVKGRSYSVAALLGSREEALRFEGGAFATFYLAPRDYHRFHAPCSVRVTKLCYLPGTLWPVNRIGVEGVDGIFAQNERICAYMQTEAGGTLCLVAVGATSVGKVRVCFDDLTTNLRNARPEVREYPPPGPAFEKGAEWGRFELGSSIVALATPGLLELDGAAPGDPVRLGVRIGTLRGGT